MNGKVLMAARVPDEESHEECKERHYEQRQIFNCATRVAVQVNLHREVLIRTLTTIFRAAAHPCPERVHIVALFRLGIFA